MRDERSNGAVDAGSEQWLPDFCSLPVFASLLLVAQVVFLVIAFAPDGARLPTPGGLLVGSLYVQWLALCCAVSLCKLRAPLIRTMPRFTPLVAYLSVLLIVAGGSVLVYQLDTLLEIGLAANAGSAARFVGGSVAVAALVAAAAFRYFYVQAQWQREVRAQARAQIVALQARIRPHFLFNSMNTIASLVRTRPDAAEQAVEDLSDLFRAALRAGDRPSTLDDELELARRYLAIEQLRLGPRLVAKWDVDDLPGDLAVPPLLLQPLLENAVHHGIQPMPDGGTIEITGTREANTALLVIRNPVAPGRRASDGNRIALDNIRQRLAYQYGGRASLDSEQGPDYYACRLRLPLP